MSADNGVILKKTKQYIIIELVDLDGKVNPIKAMLLHIDQHVLNKIEELL